jgi:hypothetical protein
MKRFSILILLLFPAFAEDEPADKTTRMFPLKYADADQIRRLFSTYSYPMSSNREFNVLTVTAPPVFHTKVEAAIKEFDVAPAPPKNIELTIYVMTGSDVLSPAPVPKELETIEKQFMTGGAFKGIRLTDTQVIRIRPGQPGESGGIRLRAAWVNTGEKGRVISFDGLKVNLKTATVNADIDIPEGQGVVIGKSNPDGLLVATAKVSE